MHIVMVGDVVSATAASLQQHHQPRHLGKTECGRRVGRLLDSSKVLLLTGFASGFVFMGSAMAEGALTSPETTFRSSCAGISLFHTLEKFEHFVLLGRT